MTPVGSAKVGGVIPRQRLSSACGLASDPFICRDHDIGARGAVSRQGRLVVGVSLPRATAAIHGIHHSIGMCGSVARKEEHDAHAVCRRLLL